jgi:uncharacterized membrane protein HdeD (DUF308 family)
MSSFVAFIRFASVRFLIGIPLGFSFALLGPQIGSFVLEKVLRDSPIGSALFGSYYFVLGVAGFAGAFNADREAVKKLTAFLSVPKWMSLVTGTTAGISIAALCKHAGAGSAFFFLTFALLFGVTAWLAKYFEDEVLNKERTGKNLQLRIWLSPTLSIVAGLIALGMTWCQVCTCL